MCNNDICVPYFSKPLGSYVTLDTAEMACESGYAFMADLKYGYCDMPPRSPNVPSPVECTAACPSANGFTTSDCKCGYNAAGTSYCEAFPGDDINQLFLVHLKAYLTNPKLQLCVIDTVLTNTCAGFIDEQELLNAVLYYKITRDFGVQVIGNDDCVKETVTSGYWNSTYIKTETN